MKIDTNVWQKYLTLREEGMSRRAACTILGLAESTIRYREKNGILPVEVSTITNTEGKVETIAVIADTQCKPGVSLEYMKWIGSYLQEKKPDVIVHIGDHFDFPSLSSYDKGKKSFEGRRLKKDIDSGVEGVRLLTEEILKDPTYKPRLVFCEGNHEHRLNRLMDEMPELEGFIKEPYEYFKDYGWETHEFLKPIEISGISFCHFLANPMTGKPYGGNALNQLKNVGNSYVVGHKQCLDIAIRPILNGKHQIGIVNGACYEFDEAYKGFQGNNHFRGLIVLHEVEEGFGLPMPVSLGYMKKKYLNGE